MQTILNQFELHTRLYNNLLHEISDEQSLQRLTKETNHIKWIAGHLLTGRYSLCELARVEKENPYTEFFSGALNDQLDYPKLKDMQEHWNEISGMLSEGISILPEKLLVKESKFKSPMGDNSVKGMLDFIMHHEGYHLGQISLLRRFVGNGKMSYR